MEKVTTSHKIGSSKFFQQKMQNSLQGLKGIEMSADDIITYRTGDTELDAIKEHNKSLDLLRKPEENNS